jgi:hypothetical protein
VNDVHWTYLPETSARWEAWKLHNGDGEKPVLYAVDMNATHTRWVIIGPTLDSPRYGELPYDMPPEELQATAIALWRLA